RVARTGIAIVSAELGVPPGPELSSLEATLRVPLIIVTSSRSDHTMRNPLLDPALRRAMDSAEQAAIAAASRHAHDEAVRHWQRALELWESIDDRDATHLLHLLLGLGQAHNAASLDSDAQHTFRRAADLARRLDDGRGLATAALGHCSDRVALSP